MKVLEVIRLLEENGWTLVSIEESDRQFKHTTRPQAWLATAVSPRAAARQE